MFKHIILADWHSICDGYICVSEKIYALIGFMWKPDESASLN